MKPRPNDRATPAVPIATSANPCAIARPTFGLARELTRVTRNGTGVDAGPPQLGVENRAGLGADRTIGQPQPFAHQVRRAGKLARITRCDDPAFLGRGEFEPDAAGIGALVVRVAARVDDRGVQPVATERVHRGAIGHRHPEDAHVRRSFRRQSREQPDREIAAPDEDGAGRTVGRLDRQMIAFEPVAYLAAADRRDRNPPRMRRCAIGAEEVLDGRPQRTREAKGDVDAWVHPAALDRPDGLTADAGGNRERALRHSFESTQTRDAAGSDRSHRLPSLPTAAWVPPSVRSRRASDGPRVT